MTLRTLLTSVALVSLAPAALAAGEGEGHDTLFTPFTDTVTHLVMIGILIFFVILWRLGVFKTVLGGLDNRAEAIRKELDEVAALRVQAPKLWLKRNAGRRKPTAKQRRSSSRLSVMRTRSLKLRNKISLTRSRAAKPRLRPGSAAPRPMPRTTCAGPLRMQRQRQPAG